MIILATDFWSSLGATGKGLAKLSNSFTFSFSSWSKWSSFRTSLRGNREGSWSRPGTALRSEIPEIDEIKENFVLFDFWQFWFHQKNTRFFFVWKNSWKQSGFVLFDCWPFWFHEKNSENYFEIRKKKSRSLLYGCWQLSFHVKKCKKKYLFVKIRESKGVLYYYWQLWFYEKNLWNYKNCILTLARRGQEMWHLWHAASTAFVACLILDQWFATRHCCPRIIWHLKL